MKKFITLMSFSRGNSFKEVSYTAVNNSLLRYDKLTRFPIIHVINAYAQKGEEIKIICILPDSPLCLENYKYLPIELEALSKDKGFHYEIIPIKVANSPNLAACLDLFQKLLNNLDEDDTVYACLTYGLKTMPIVMLTAIQYANSTFQRLSVDCIVYGELYSRNRKSSEPDEILKGSIHDITALIQINELAGLLAEKKVSNPKEIIKQILTNPDA